MTLELQLSDLEFRLLQDLVHERFGISFPDHKRSFLRRQLETRLLGLGLGSFGEYYQALRFGDPDGSEGRRLISLLTNNETYFFRESAQLDALRDHLLPEIKERRAASGERRLRVVSAGCSSGEEVYSAAIAIYETGEFFWSWDVQVLGIDVDSAVLDVARRGQYAERSLRMTSPEQRDRYFASVDDRWAVKNGVNRLVRFQWGNLVDPELWRSLGEVDVILCRNVLIYFSEASMRRVLRSFHSVLAPGGYLLLGHSESVSCWESGFEPVRLAQAIVYRKG
jgi:chemotaxis protein methyltransferase CheR